MSNKAKGKSWFGCLDSFSKLDYDWTLLEEAVSMMNGTHPLLHPDFDSTTQGPPDADAEVAPPSTDPATRAAFQLLRQSYESSHIMVEEFLHDFEGHIKMRTLVLVGRVLQKEYVSALDRHSRGQLSTLLYQADRAGGLWFETIKKLFKLLDSESVHSRLDFRARSSNVIADMDDPTLAKDTRRAKDLFSLIVELSKARCWSQLHHTLCFPNAFVRVFNTPEKLTESSCFLRKLVTCLKMAASASAAAPDNEALQKFYADLGTIDWVLTREFVATLEKYDYNLKAQELRELAFATFASTAETKSVCENSFAWLHDKLARQSKANKANPYTKYMYLATCPYPQQGGTAMIIPQAKDIRSWMPADTKEFESLQVFKDGPHGPRAS